MRPSGLSDGEAGRQLVCELDVPAASTAGHDLATVVQACGPGAGTEVGTESPLPPLLIGLRLSLMLDNLTLQPALC
jgi:hypothetical protein